MKWNETAFINGKHVVGEVKEKEVAHREYKKAISEGHGAYLMDEETPVHSSFIFHFPFFEWSSQSIFSFSFSLFSRMCLPSLLAISHPTQQQSSKLPMSRNWLLKETMWSSPFLILLLPPKKKRHSRFQNFVFGVLSSDFPLIFFFFLFLFFLLDQMWFRLWPKLSMKQSRQIPISWVEDSASRCLLKWPQKS